MFLHQDVLRRFAGGLALALFPAWAAAQSGPAEHQVKAAFLYNFAKYVEWPAEALPAGSPVTLCLFGRDPFGAALAQLEGRQVQGRPFRVRRGVTEDDAAGCHLAFIADSEERRLPALLKALTGMPVLTISDIEGFVDAGGQIGVGVAEGRLQFDANLTALQRANLRASSQALKLARNVHGLKK